MHSYDAAPNWLAGLRDSGRGRADGSAYDRVAMARGYNDPRWLTYNQARKAGGSVRKGEKETLVTLWKTYKVDEDGEEKDRFVLRGFTVFSAEQCDGLNLPELELIQVEDQAVTNGYAESLVKASGAVYGMAEYVLPTRREATESSCRSSSDLTPNKPTGQPCFMS